MSDNNHLISNPDYEQMIKSGDALPRLTTPASDDQLVAREIAGRVIKKELITLSELNPADFSLTDYDIVPITMSKRNGERIDAGWPIKSIPSKILDVINEPYQDIMQRMPKRRNPQTGVSEPDEGSPKYNAMMSEFRAVQNKFAYRKLLEGTNMVIRDEDGNVVWNPDNPREQHVENSIMALDRMGIRINQMRAINEGIDKLSVTLAVEEMEDFLQP